jgi:hypothetical protein
MSNLFRLGQEKLNVGRDVEKKEFLHVGGRNAN